MQFTIFADVPGTGQVQLNGEAIDATYSVDSVTGNVTISAPSGSALSDTILEFEAGDQVALQLDRPGLNIIIEERTGGSISHMAGTVLFVSASGNSEVLVIDPASYGYQYQTFGAWFDGLNANAGTVGAGSYGARSQASDIPAAGSTTATYNGFSIGTASVPGGTAYVTVSDLGVTTDFDTMTITSTNTGGFDIGPAAAGQTPLPELDFTGSGAVAGIGFSAPISGTTSAISGAADGQFFGPGAAEVGGTFSATGGGINYLGAFGARR
ncbi:transferrin-binding protein-like solute binding protein [Tropicimonas sp. S265A]|uniref:transferrin-binding protein-like solute binding protein n=1 Tax=Tropicimonas sp. S265A TaxID=3415134 RepID=UPI003C79E43B